MLRGTEMNANGHPTDCYNELDNAQRRLRLVQGSVLNLMDERFRLATALESVEQAQTLNEARNLATDALRL